MLNCILAHLSSARAHDFNTSHQTPVYNTLQHTATHCNTLQHTATHCNIPQHTATHCNTLQHKPSHSRQVTLQKLTSLFPQVILGGVVNEETESLRYGKYFGGKEVVRPCTAGVRMNAVNYHWETGPS